MISVAMATLDPRPYPSHNTRMGARAKTGTAWLMTRTGMSHWRTDRKYPIINALAVPRILPSKSPRRISLSVIRA